MNAYNGFSTNQNALQAGIEAAKMAGHSSTAKIVFAYVSCDYNVKKVIEGLKQVYDCPIIGNTSFTGVILPNGYVGGNTPFVGILTVCGNDLEVGVACVKKSSPDECAVAIGEAVAKKALKDAGFNYAPQVMYMAASPTEEEYFLKGISKVVGRVPFFGGSAADNTIEGNWSLFANTTVFPEGVAVAFIYTNKDFANVFTGAYRETADMGIITKVDGHRTLVEINGKPALKEYVKWRGMNPKQLMGGNLLSATITSPLGVKDPLGDLIAIRHPMAGNADFSMNIGNKLATGTCVIRMEASVDELIKSVETTLVELNKRLGKPAAFYHLVHCGGRRAGIDARINEVYDAIKRVVPNTPFITEFTFGEYGYEKDGRNTCGGLMLSFTAFAK